MVSFVIHRSEDIQIEVRFCGVLYLSPRNFASYLDLNNYFSTSIGTGLLCKYVKRDSTVLHNHEDTAF